MAVQTPAIVIGAGINGLGVARSLWRARVPVWLLDCDPRRPEMRTRAAQPLTVPALHGEALVQELIHLASKQFAGMRPVLFLTQEETVRTISHHRERLSDFYRFSLPGKEMVDALQHKEGFQRLAEKLGSPIPPLVRVGELDGMPAIERLRYPVVIKPGERHAEYSRQFKKAYRADSAEEAAGLVRRILPVMQDVVVQEWIEGPDSNIYFCLQYVDGQGNAAASFTGRKIRSWPPQVGGTASCVVAPEAHDELTRMTARFFESTGVRGMASMEYKRDTRSGEFLMVEPTIGRTDYQQEVATLNGINMPYVAWCSAMDLPLPKAALTNRPVVWRVQSEDAQSATAQGQSIGQGYPQGCDVSDALWRWRDPMPALLKTWRRAASALERRTSRLMAESPTAGRKL